MQLILASNSPRRKFILEKEGYTFKVITSSFEEKTNDLSPIETAVNNALGKAKDVFNKLENKENSVVLGADTIVVFDNKIIGKPKDEEDAFLTLKILSSNTHEVVTGFAVIVKNKIIKGYDLSKVTFKNLSDKFISDYVKTGKPLDKAGSYGLQDGVDIAEKYEGSYYNIIGLPFEKIKPLIDELLKK